MPTLRAYDYTKDNVIEQVALRKDIWMSYAENAQIVVAQGNTHTYLKGNITPDGLALLFEHYVQRADQLQASEIPHIIDITGEEPSLIFLEPVVSENGARVMRYRRETFRIEERGIAPR